MQNLRQFFFCFVLVASGTLSRLFTNNMDEQNVFLKGMKPNDTSCSNIQGYMIEITRTNKTYHHDIKQLNQSSAKKSCEHARDCRPVSAGMSIYDNFTLIYL